MYKKDLEFGDPKNFQRKVYDISYNVLNGKGYYYSGYHSRRPFLQANGIRNLADFDGVLCFIRRHTNYNLITRIIGSILIGIGILFLVSEYLWPIFTTYQSPLNSLIFFAIGTILFFVKFGKDICIKIRLTGESYRTNEKKHENTIEYLDVRSHARLTIQGTVLDSRKRLSDKERQILHDDGELVVNELSELLEAFAEK